MRILFISNFYPPHDLGGMEIRCQETVQSLQMRGHTCHVLTSNFGAQEQSQSEAGVTRTLHLQAGVYHYRPLSFFLHRPQQENANRRALRRVLDMFQPDIVFIWGMWNLSLCIAHLAEQQMPGRVAYSVAGYWLMLPNAHESYWQQPSQHPVAKALMTPAKHLALRILARDKKKHPLILEQVACVSEFVCWKLGQAGVLPQGASVIYNGVDPQPFLNASTKRGNEQQGICLRLVYTGGLVAQKGVLTAVEAIGLLQQKGESCGLHLTLVGSGHPEYEAQLHQRIADLNLSEQITFCGRVQRVEIAKILAEHDVFLFTSMYEEPLARSVMEAMAAGLAVIGTPVGGQSEIFEDGINALIFPPNDAAKLAEHILSLKYNPTLLTRLAEEGRRTVLDRFTLDRMVDQMEVWLREIVG